MKERRGKGSHGRPVSPPEARVLPDSGGEWTTRDGRREEGVPAFQRQAHAGWTRPNEEIFVADLAVTIRTAPLASDE